ncbi:hypothetical protein [Pseudobdellovibrio exovorus]|uniref:Uncharacterized protein n=1 Tax=Pseudobdellovibrio exovorus JSS TaxID=1184267 RepID=M4VFF7_9BACT|nr:hypothetical protein [Pseudobdellovibrio exovorus]AGH96786.1 hypothetical protein A11Q_2570 [Pseudobdellovibrio exovorus JSS]
MNKKKFIQMLYIAGYGTAYLFRQLSHFKTVVMHYNSYKGGFEFAFGKHGWN